MLIHAFFVFNGHARPDLKRGAHVRKKSHWLALPFQELLDAFGFTWYKAPGKAEAELAALNQQGLINMVLTTDSDTVVFGATCIARWYVLGVLHHWVIDSIYTVYFFSCLHQPFKTGLI